MRFSTLVAAALLLSFAVPSSAQEWIRLCQQGGPVYRQLPGPAQGDPDDLHVAVRRRSAGTRLQRRAGKSRYSMTVVDYSQIEKLLVREGAEVRRTNRRMLRRHRVFGRRTLAPRFSRRASSACDRGVHAARCEGHAADLEYLLQRWRPAGPPDESRRIAHQGGRLHAQPEAVHQRRHRRRQDIRTPGSSSSRSDGSTRTAGTSATSRCITTRSRRRRAGTRPGKSEGTDDT